MIENHISQSTFSHIPDTIKERREFLYKRLNRYQGVSVYNNSLKANVKINGKSIEETVFHAGKGLSSAKLALNIIHIIRNARRYGHKDGYPPHSNRQTEMKIERIFLFKCAVKGIGTANLTIGRKRSGNYVEYCISDIKYASPLGTTD